MHNWFLKIEFYRGRKTVRERCKLSEALMFVCGLPLGEWRHIRNLSIERIN